MMNPALGMMLDPFGDMSTRKQIARKFFGPFFNWADDRQLRDWLRKQDPDELEQFLDTQNFTFRPDRAILGREVLQDLRQGAAWASVAPPVDRSLLALEARASLALLASALLALMLANSPASGMYFAFVEHPVLGRKLHCWISNGPMSLFFLLVGLGLKRELIEGQLASASARALAIMAALGGLVVPALIYLAVNLAENGPLRGWPVPSATDIAFALAVLALLGTRVPAALRTFLAAVTLLDYLGAATILALFYTPHLHPAALAGALFALILLGAANRLGQRSLVVYLTLGTVLWGFLLLAGIHPSVAGLLVAMLVPLDGAAGGATLHRLERGLRPVVAFAILPVFAFTKAGISFSHVDVASLLNPVVVGTALGLFAGNQLGIFASVWLAVSTSAADRPAGATWLQLYGVAALCGIGFTMSLFAGSLALEPMPELVGQAQIGAVMGSIASALLGWTILRFAPRSRR